LLILFFVGADHVAFVMNLSAQATEDDLRVAFATCGTIKDVRIVRTLDS
jgi:RNA recognition motif-containing protein